MNQPRGERLPKGLRLRKRTEYLRFQHATWKVHSDAFLGLVSFEASGPSRLGITTTRRVGNSVTRNRLRRVVREAFRRGWMGVPDHVALVVVAKKQAGGMVNRALFCDLSVLGRRIRRIREGAR